MKNPISVSNIAWNREENKDVYEYFNASGVSGIEVAFTKIAPWAELNKSLIDHERSELDSAGLVVSSYQALYYGKPQVQLLHERKSFDEMLSHTIAVAKLAERLSNGGVAVFGAPLNRKRGDLSLADAEDLGSERLFELADAVADYGLVLALEPAPPSYQGDFLIDTESCARVVRRINHSNLRLHLDSGCIALAEDNVAPIASYAGGLIAHAHLSRPGLAPLVAPPDQADLMFIQTIRELSYSGWIALEMRPLNTISAIKDAVTFARRLINSSDSI
ncbi:sugar phosphate isomerase/epimerase family protein [Methylobacterium segetis]|uniref:sugar phosphate isomerase/epimerase family protein n=1 Tax=Methylobacterium segetis TaxID=2488750 RepID=UPI00104C2BEA|nr:sugar phosphate isomerase/epimerase [Methylobacterium segetis]